MIFIAHLSSPRDWGIQLKQGTGESWGMREALKMVQPWGRGQGSGDGARLIFSLRRGQREIVKKRAVSGPIGVQAEELFLRQAPGVIGPPRQPRRALTCGPGLAARARAGGLVPRPRVEPRAVAARGRTARKRRGTPDEFPRRRGGASGGPGAQVK
ncbi:hypothetical protein NDU88_004690 [Pleurodeles waltl]|uniref:Uncharacterized protein n=1 Tax=Pleurodeles waltl TaxID=8319 RepID=A0AAV7LJD9_PLEWA|nr:hypothetical protein NDU88_004690 [Pleurodeles waltl]